MIDLNKPKEIQNKNPWGGGGNDNGPKNPWGNGGHGGGERPPELDEMLRKAQENFRQVMPEKFGGGKIVTLIFLAIVGLWMASGFYIVNPGEHAVIQRFGEWDRTKAEEGLGYNFPWPIEANTKVNVSELRKMTIGFSELSTRAGTQTRDIPDESLMLTSDANIVDLDLVVLWNIKSAEDYLFQIRDPENTIKKVVESAIREVVGQTEMFPIITTERSTVQDLARDIMIKNLDDYKSGVNISQVLIQEAEVHPDVQNAFQEVQSAKQVAIDTQNRAQAYREDIIPRARGEAIKMIQEAEAYKESVIARSTGDAERFKAVYEAYLTGQDVTKKRMYLETMERVLQNAQKIVLDQENGAGSGVVPYLPLNELNKKTK